MPDFVAVTAAYISTKIWIFKNSAKSIASLEASADSLHVGQFNTVPLIVTAKDINGSESIVTTFCRYTIRDTSIIKCIGDSLLYGAYPGSTTVIASYWGHTDSFTIRVDTTALLPDSLNINKDTVTVMANDSSIIQATGYYHSASLLFTQTVNQLASWNSRSSSIATIINGIVKGVIHGTTQIVCSYKGKSDSCVIKVIPYVSFIRRINFGCATTQVKDGWISATNAAYSASTGFGWTTANGGCRSDRRDNILLKSFVLSSSATPSSWKIDLPDGAYRIRIAMGDNMYDTDATYSWTAAGSDTLIRHKGKTNTIADNHLTVSGGAGLSLTVKGAVNYIVIIADEGVSLADVADDYQTKDFTTGAQTYTLINQCEQSRLSLSPNPFNPTLFINLTVPAKESNYSLKVYSTNGTLIEDLSSFTSKGRLIWAPKTNSSAAYIIRLVNGTTAISRKVYLLK
ncbi:MAG: hypothetical protein JNL74_19040 [Fibrobacteres bacterium]|nr:hypothetical protein [Fibrobacterota bacterium]